MSQSIVIPIVCDSMRFYAIVCDDSIFRNRGSAFTMMVHPATRPANLVISQKRTRFLKYATTHRTHRTHRTHGWWRTATPGRGRVRLRTTIYVRVYERTAELWHFETVPNKHPMKRHGLRSIGDTVPNKHPTRDSLHPDYYPVSSDSSILH